MSGRADPVSILARQFKVSNLVILRRLFDVGLLDWTTFRARYIDQENRYHERSAGQSGGGDFYGTQRVRLSTLFINAVIEAALEGQVSRREAFPLLGIKKTATFVEVARRQGFPV
jgi:Zn-dependent peptidase ImmA (M78 family)